MYLSNALGLNILQTLAYKDKYVIVVEDAAALKNLTPDFTILSQYTAYGFIVTAQDTHYDFISRFLKPNATLQEDAVTGSAHCILAPYWAQRLNKNKLHAYQASARGGEIICEIKNQRVLLHGQAALYLEGYYYL